MFEKFWGYLRNREEFRKEIRNPLPFRLRQESVLHGKAALVVQSLRHGNAMGNRFSDFRGMAFQCMAECVPEVQNMPEMFIFRVFFDHLLLEIDAKVNKFCSDFGQGFHFAQVIKKLRRPDERILDQLPESAPKLFFRQCFQKSNIYRELYIRKIERADGIFQVMEVNSRLATDGGVNHGEKRGGNIGVTDAALVGRGHETADVADRPSSEIQQKGVSIALLVSKITPNLNSRVYRFGLFTTWQDNFI